MELDSNCMTSDLLLNFSEHVSTSVKQVKQLYIQLIQVENYMNIQVILQYTKNYYTNSKYSIKAD